MDTPIEEQMVNHIGTLPKDKIAEFCDEMGRRLNFEKRLASMTDDELRRIGDPILTKEQRKVLDACTSEKQRDERITGWARAHYFVKVMWLDWLNGVTDKRPL